MRKFGFALTLMGVMACGLGCSQETVDKAKDAADATGDAAASAVDDAAAAVDEAADDIAATVDGEEDSEETAE